MLHVRNLTLARSGVAYLSKVSFDLGAGQMIELRGRNGAGKSSLLRSLAGLSPWLEGEIDSPPDQTVWAGHDDGLKPSLSVAEHISFWSQLYRSDRHAQAYDQFNLKALRHRRAASLSAGQKRRLSLARLVISMRKIWLLDEPTVSLDSVSTQRFGQSLGQHLGEGGCALIATHIPMPIAADQVLDLTAFRIEAHRGAPK